MAQGTGHRGHRARATGHRAQDTGHKPQGTGYRQGFGGTRAQGTGTGHKAQDTQGTRPVHGAQGTGHRERMVEAALLRAGESATEEGDERAWAAELEN